MANMDLPEMHYYLFVFLAFFAQPPLGQGNAARAAPASGAFVLEEYFVGRSVARGRFRAINGVDRKFDVELLGTWDGRTLTLTEDFLFEDGARDRKVWRFEKIAPGHYLGRRDDVIGDVDVRIDGPTARFSYRLYLDAENRRNLVRFRDRMTLLADGGVRNTATVFKFGIPVAWVEVDFSRPEAAGSSPRIPGRLGDE
jgi:hypothetical protein